MSAVKTSMASTIRRRVVAGTTNIASSCSSSSRIPVPTCSSSSSSSSYRTRCRSLATQVEAPATAPSSSSSAPPAPAAGAVSRPAPDGTVRSNWLRRDVQQIFDAPLMSLIYRAASVHRQHHDPSTIQLCKLANIKQGGCEEDCGYCSQSRHHKGTPTKAEPLVQLEPLLVEARKAKEQGATRFCMGAAWRGVDGRPRQFKRILEMVKEVRGMGMEVCTTLGMLSREQAVALKNAGLSAYNHNLDTSAEYYPKVITTRTYADRLETLANVRDAGINVCSGGILGLGEADEDRVGLIWEVARLPQHPESFPVNTLVPIEGTPLEKNEPVPVHTVLRTIATARIVMPRTTIRLAAGRHAFTEAEQALAFMAGANAIFTGDTMLTTPCSPWDEDKQMLGRWGLRGQKSFEVLPDEQQQHSQTEGVQASTEGQQAAVQAAV